MTQTKTIAVVLLAIAAVGAIGIAIGTTTQSAHAQLTKPGATHLGPFGTCPPVQGYFCQRAVLTPSGNENQNIKDHVNKIPNQ